MKILGINKETCIKCLECVRECPIGLYCSPPTENEKNREVIFDNKYNRCNVCGHCISICPTNSILYESEELASEFEEAKDPGSIINFENMMKVLKSRRSVRRYKDKPVPREDIEAILEAMRYAPSASNMQSWKYIVIINKESIKRLIDLVGGLMKKIQKILKFAKFLKPIIPKKIKQRALDPGTKISVNNFIKQLDNGEDPVFYGAPVVIITYAPKYGSMAPNDAGIALTYGMLAAQSRNLATCWIGMAQEAIKRSKETRKWLKIPKNRKVNGVLIVGYPAVKFHRTPPRKPLNIKWD